MLDETTRIHTDVSISDLVSEYLDDCRIRNLSPTTLRWYGDRLTLILVDHWDAPVSSFRLPHVKAIMAKLLETRAPATVNGYLRRLKSMMCYAIDNDYPVAFAPRRVKKIREPKRIPPCFTVEQVEAGTSVAEICRKMGIAEHACYKWRSESGGLRLDQPKRLKELERENARLRKLVGNQALDIDILKEAASGNS